MPKIEQQIGDVMVRSHTFRFITAVRHGNVEGAERMHRVSHGQDERLGC